MEIYFQEGQFTRLGSAAQSAAEGSEARRLSVSLGTPRFRRMITECSLGAPELALWRYAKLQPSRNAREE
jgi:hypothetical protein